MELKQAEAVPRAHDDTTATFLSMNKMEVWKPVEETGDKRLQANPGE
jgi:hypothetical protein